MNESKKEIISILYNCLLKYKALKATYQCKFDKISNDYKKLTNNPVTKHNYNIINQKLYDKREIGSNINSIKHIINNIENIILRTNEL